MKPTDAERQQARELFMGRHSERQWDSLVWFYSRPLWQQRLLRWGFEIFVRTRIR